MRYRLFLLGVGMTCALHAQAPSSFSQAKRLVYQMFSSHPHTVYCHCLYHQKTVDLDSCGMRAASPKARAHRVEIEHFMAAEHFGQQFACWRKPDCLSPRGTPLRGRACCRATDARFREVESELYNLWPAVGLVNDARSNYRFGMVTGPHSFYGCDVAIDKEHRRIEPAAQVKGLVARAHLFMRDHYRLRLSPAQTQLFLAWNKQVPADAWECAWAEQVKAFEDYSNPWIEAWCIK